MCGDVLSPLERLPRSSGKEALMSTELQIIQPTALEAMTRAEHDVQVTTAKRYPRDVVQALTETRNLAMIDREIARECYYNLPRDGKNIEGPSIRFAELLKYKWGNISTASRVVDIGEKEVTCAAICIDMENNSRGYSEVKRRIVNRQGKRYTDDMILVTANAGCKIALRNAVFEVIPKAVWHGIFKEIMKFALADAKPMEERRKVAVAYFVKQGVTAKQVFAQIGVSQLKDIGEEHLKTLRGIANAIQEGVTTVEEAFADEMSTPAPIAEFPGLPPVQEAPQAAPVVAPAPKPAPSPPATKPPETTVEPAASPPTPESTFPLQVTPSKPEEQQELDTPPLTDHAELWAIWEELRAKLSREQLQWVRGKAQVYKIHSKLTYDKLRAVVEAAQECLAASQTEEG